jgi:peptidyl-prolyl cis-trans isomerase B (cyclophilin B)
MRVKEHLKIQTCMILSLVSLSSAFMLSVGSAHGADKSDKKEEKVAKASKSDPVVVFETTKGTIKAELYKDLAPKTVENFVGLVNKGFYNGLTFHRYEPGFCIQGGDPNGNGTGDSGTRIPLEQNLKNPLTRHSVINGCLPLAMARSQNPDSASCQFYFALAPQPGLDQPPEGPGYAVFGRTLDAGSTLNVKSLRKGDKMTKVYIEK